MPTNTATRAKRVILLTYYLVIEAEDVLPEKAPWRSMMVRDIVIHELLGRYF